MPASSSRRILLSGIAVLGLLGVVGYLVFDTNPVDLDGLEVFAPPEKGKTIGPAPDMKSSGGGTTRVRVELATLARVLPVRQPRPTCELVNSLDRPEAKGIEGTWVAGLAALPIAPVARGQQLVRFRLAGGRDHYRVTRLVPGDAGRILLLRGLTKNTNGRVVDAEGKPVSQASVWLAGESATTDAEGKFTIDAIPADSGLPLVVRKAGYAALYRVLTGRQYDELRQRPLTLREGTALHVRFNAEKFDPEARYYVLPAGGRDSRLLEYPFFMQAIEDGFELRDGMVVFPYLPRGARVRVRVLHSGFAPAKSPEIGLDEPVVATVVRSSPRPALAASVVDVQGRPVANAWLTSRAGDSRVTLSDTGWLLAPLAYVDEGHAARVDENGTFSLSRLADAKGVTALTVEAEGFFGLEIPADVSGIESPIVLYERQPIGDPGLVLRAGAQLSGTVRVTVQDESGDLLGPYSWDTAKPFPLRITRRSLLRVAAWVGTGPIVTRRVLVTGETEISVGK